VSIVDSTSVLSYNAKALRDMLSYGAVVNWIYRHRFMAGWHWQKVWSRLAFTI